MRGAASSTKLIAIGVRIKQIFVIIRFTVKRVGAQKLVFNLDCLCHLNPLVVIVFGKLLSRKLPTLCRDSNTKEP